jgi:hypothetical protein
VTGPPREKKMKMDSWARKVDMELAEKWTWNLGKSFREAARVVGGANVTRCRGSGGWRTTLHFPTCQDRRKELPSWTMIISC